MFQPSVVVVILNWNGKKFLEKFLPSVMNATYTNFKVVVADNASDDDSVSYLQSQFPSVNIIINPSNEGFAKGYNTALKQVEADYYVLLNSDVEVTPAWIEPVIELMESDKKICACQPKLLSFNDKYKFEYAGASGGWIDSFGYPFTRGRVFDDCEKDMGQYDDAVPCFWATGAAMFIRADIYHEMNGLDEYFFAHQEEIDLCWRMQLFGYKVYVQPKSVVYHVGGGTLPKGNSRKVFLNFRNNLIMLAKNFPFWKACWKIPVRFGLDAVAGCKGLLAGDSQYFMAIAKSHTAFLYWLFFIKRATPKPKFSTSEFSGWYRGLLIWDYFFKNKKTFKEIIGAK
jgi:hypothetical protein